MCGVSVSRQYERTHRAIREQARVLGIEPFSMRVVLSIAESETGTLDTAELEGELHCVGDGAAIRRAMGELFEAGLVAGERKRGVRTRLTLEPLAVDAARAVREVALGP